MRILRSLVFTAASWAIVACGVSFGTGQEVVSIVNGADSIGVLGALGVVLYQVADLAHIGRSSNGRFWLADVIDAKSRK